MDLDAVDSLQVAPDSRESNGTIAIGLVGVEEGSTVDAESDAVHQLAVDGELLGNLVELQEAIATAGESLRIFEVVDISETTPDLRLVVSVLSEMVAAVGDVTTDVRPWNPVSGGLFAVRTFARFVFDWADVRTEARSNSLFVSTATRFTRHR